MNPEEFRENGKKLVDFIADYIKNIGNKRVIPDVKPGYLRKCLPPLPPQISEPYEAIMKDFDNFILPGVAHWQHPQFYAYFPAGNSFPAILGDMLANAMATNSFSWASCPASTELETLVLDWFGTMLALPSKFLSYTSNSKGGGVIQSSASDSVFVILLAARHTAIQKLNHAAFENPELASKLVAYTSKEAHSSVEKACKLGMIKLRQLDTDCKFRLRGDTLKEAIQKDKDNGLVPFLVVATLGTTSNCAFDVIPEIGPICKKYDIWLHIDAAYAGNSLICQEYRYLSKGIDYATSFTTNPYKLLNVTLDCSTMWVEDHSKLTSTFAVDPIYLTHNYGDKFKGGTVDYRHWGISLSRRFRSLKLWFVIRMYGVQGLQEFIRKHVKLAKKFEQLLREDELFEIVNEVTLGLVVFRIRGTNNINQIFLNRLNESGLIYMVPALLDNTFVIRFCVCAENATYETIQASYQLMKKCAVEIIDEFRITKKPIRTISLPTEHMARKVGVPKSSIYNIKSKTDHIRL